MEREDYEILIRDFSGSLNKINPNISFFVYGSYLRNDFVPGVSDLDGFLILEDDHGITNKNELMKISLALGEASRKKDKIKLQFNILDELNSLDGRFSSYPKAYTDFFKNNSLKLNGHFPLEEMRGFDYKFSELGSISHNLRKVRNGFLNYYVNSYKGNRESLEKAVSSPLKSLSQLPKQIVNLSKRDVIENKGSALGAFQKIFPNYDSGFIRRVNSILSSEDNFNRLINNPYALDFSLNCLTEMEDIIWNYIEKNPEPSIGEVIDSL